MTKNDKKVIDFGQVELNARKRDFEAEKEIFKQEHNNVEEEEFNRALDIISKATGKNIGVYTKRSPQSKVRFAQFLQKNWEYLRDQNYFTTEEKAFLIDIQSNISMHSNAIVDDIMKRPPNALNISEIANLRGSSRQKTSKIINGLIKKGIFSKAVSGEVKDINQAKDYVLFINPNIIYVGDRDDVEEHLILMFDKQMKNNSVLKNLPQKLF